MIGWQKSGTPVLRAAMGERRADGHETWQVFILRAQSIRNPRAHAGSHESIAASVDFQACPTVCGIRAVHRVDNAEVINVPGDMRKQFADRSPAFTMRLEFPWRG